MTTSPRQRLQSMQHPLQRIVLAGGALAMAVGPLAAGVAVAQSYGTVQPTYGQSQTPTYDQDPNGTYNGQPQYNQGQYNQGQYNQGQPNQPQYNQGQYNQGQYNTQNPYPQTNGGDYRAPAEPGAPSGYDGTLPPPPPPGYTGANTVQYSAADQRYAQTAEGWARDNCIKSRGNVAGGAVLGGVLGALIGGALGGRHDHGAGVLAGAAVGAVGGAAVASSTGGATSPGCPPGYVVRGNAVAYDYAPADYYYAAPDWYRPWVFIDNSWVYRPYPYHDYYYRTWRGGYGGPGWHGGGPRGGYGGGYRGGYGGGHGGPGGWRR